MPQALQDAALPASLAASLTGLSSSPPLLLLQPGAFFHRHQAHPPGWALSALSLPRGEEGEACCSRRAAGLLSLVLGAKARRREGSRHPGPSFLGLGLDGGPLGGQKEVGNRQAWGQYQLMFTGSQGEPDLRDPHSAIWERGCWRNACRSTSKRRTAPTPVLTRLFHKRWFSVLQSPGVRRGSASPAITAFLELGSRLQCR